LKYEIINSKDYFLTSGYAEDLTSDVE